MSTLLPLPELPETDKRFDEWVELCGLCPKKAIHSCGKAGHYSLDQFQLSLRKEGWRFGLEKAHWTCRACSQRIVTTQEEDERLTQEKNAAKAAKAVRAPKAPKPPKAVNPDKQTVPVQLSWEFDL